MKLCVSDKLTTGEFRRTADGYLLTEARIARTGMYQYAGHEMGRADKAMLNIYRPEETVFSDASMATWAHKPITVDHPASDVTPDNYRDLARGFAGGEIKRDGEFVVVPLMLTDREAIDAVQAGKRGLSAGYAVEVDMTPGVTDSGEAYDGVMVGAIQGNHIAIVGNPRAGTFIGDSFPPTEKEAPVVSTKTITFDGLPLLVTDAAEAAIGKLQTAITDRDATITALTADVAARDADLAKRDAEIETLKASAPDQTAIDKLADEKAEVVSRARAIVGDKLGDTAGKSAADIRRAAVVAKLGDAVAAGKSDDYIAARFDGMTEGKSALADAVTDAAGKPVKDAEVVAFDAYANRFNRAKKEA